MCDRETARARAGRGSVRPCERQLVSFDHRSNDYSAPLSHRTRRRLLQKGRSLHTPKGAMLLCHLAFLPLVRHVPPLAAFPKTFFSSPISRSALRWGWHRNRRPSERRGSRRPDRQIGGSRSHSMESKTEARDPAAESPAALADGGKGVRLKLEEFNWDHSFVRELPGDPRSDTIPRQVLLLPFLH